jgi:hypothetical protein
MTNPSLVSVEVVLLPQVTGANAQALGPVMLPAGGSAGNMGALVLPSWTCNAAVPVTK